MIDLIVEIDLETVISFGQEDEAVFEAAAEHIRNNWFEFILKHKGDFTPKVFCEIKE